MNVFLLQFNPFIFPFLCKSNAVNPLNITGRGLSLLKIKTHRRVFRSGKNFIIPENQDFYVCDKKEMTVAPALFDNAKAVSF